MELIKQQKKVTEKQLKAAVQYCLHDNCRRYSAVKSGLFPLIKDRRTIGKQLEGRKELEKKKNTSGIYFKFWVEI